MYKEWMLKEILPTSFLKIIDHSKHTDLGSKSEELYSRIK